MAHNTEAGSDDEFHEALSYQPGQSMDEKSLEELIEKQKKLELEDNNESAAGGAPKETKPEIMDEIIDEESLRDLEKTMTEEELEANKEKALKMKERGNELFKNGDAELSIEVYTDALRICPTTAPKDRAILYGNRAAAKIKLDSKKSAIQDCTQALSLWPEYVRVLVRRAKLNELEDNPHDALEDYKRVCELDPGHKEAREAMIRLPPIVNERNERLKEEMMSKLKDLGNMILNPFGLSTDNFQMKQDPNTGSYSINFNQDRS